MSTGFTKVGDLAAGITTAAAGTYAPVCDACRDTAWVTIDGRLARCECWVERLAARQLAECGVPTRYKDARLRGYQPRTAAQKRAYEAAVSFTKAFPAQRGIWLFGGPGTGKTHLAAAILRSTIVGRRAKGRFAGVSELLHAVRHSYSNDNEDRELAILRPAMETDLLVLDDIGSDRATEWAQTTIGALVNDRYNNQRPTIFTSNLVDTEATDPHSVLLNLGVRTRSRLREMCTWIEL